MVADLKLLDPKDHSADLSAEEAAEASDGRKQRVLLLEDDADFKGILHEYLEAHEFEVVAVNNGAEGVREIMASEFDAIVCDMMMPGLPGDMFYFAVERMRPQMCGRFIFMTGLQGNDRLTQFIAKSDGTIIHKPFNVQDLLEMIGFVQVRALVNGWN